MAKEALLCEAMRIVAESVFSLVFPDTQTDLVTDDVLEDSEFYSAYLSDGKQLQAKFFDSLEKVQAYLRDRIHLRLAAKKTEALLTQCVRVTGNFPLVPEDAVLVDLPGLEDVNMLRSNIAERYFSLHCTHGWFCLPKPE